MRSAFGRRAVTVQDVARASGVSPATVTRVLRGHPVVRPDTRRRVERAAASLGYIPNSIAQALATQSTRTVGVLVPSSGDGFWGEVVAAIENRAAAAEFSVLLANGHGDDGRERRAIELFLSRRVEGIILTSTQSDLKTWYANAPVPVVRINWDLALPDGYIARARRLSIRQLDETAQKLMADSPFEIVAFDDMAAARELTEYLLSLGHKDIAFVGLAPRLPSLLRYVGCMMALNDVGLRPVAVVECELTSEAARSATLSLLSRHSPSAIVAFDDLTAVGVMRGIRASGLSVPGDISVVGFDDIEFAAFVDPPLTTMGQPKEDLGAQAMSLVLAQSAARKQGQVHSLPGQLVVRMSCDHRPY